MMNIAAFLIVICLSFLVGDRIYVVTLNAFDPFFYHSVSVATPRVRCGEKFEEILDVQRYRVCKVEIDRYVVSDVTKRVIYRERIAGGATGIGRTKDVRNNFTVPTKDSGLCDVGPATVFQNVHSECIDGMHSMQWPTLHFEIVD